MNFRFDRLATLYLVSPVMRLGRKGQDAIPILMYHSISNSDEFARHAYYRTTTPPATFAAQLRLLHREGFQTLSPKQAVDALNASDSVAKRAVVITFDDGLRDFYLDAYPALEEFGFTATMYLPTDHIGDVRRQFKGRDCLTWSEVRELQSHGIQFGSHTVTHPQLHTLSKAAVEREITESKLVMEEKTSMAVESFAYPYAFPQVDIEFRAMLRELLLGAGYKTGVCTSIGRAGLSSDPLFMERLPVNGCDDPSLFQAKLLGAYDWVGRTQTMAKMGRALARGPKRRL